ncbi:hypothetical protein [Neobacillus niacini]|uniref:hypothetical protein n=1 Tax=Neobacillus niacini TaxID=86668 RepID=UPI0037C96AC7
MLLKQANIFLKDYEEQLKQGKDPEFNSTNLGIKNAEFWANGYQSKDQEEKKRVAN